MGKKLSESLRKARGTPIQAEKGTQWEQVDTFEALLEAVNVTLDGKKLPKVHKVRGSNTKAK